MRILDLIFPKYCVNCKKYGNFLCTDCFSKLSFDTKNICLACGKSSYNGLTHPICKTRNTIEGSFTGVVFNSVSKKLVYQFKYKPYLSGLSEFISDLLYESLIQNEEFNRIDYKNFVLVPIPLSRSKMRKRGYNQAEILANTLAKKLNIDVVKVLKRQKETKSQVGLSKDERKNNVKGAFVANKIDLAGKNILLIDDVLTTGSTFYEASKVLKLARANRIFAIALAREQ